MGPLNYFMAHSTSIWWDPLNSFYGTVHLNLLLPIDHVANFCFPAVITVPRTITAFYSPRITSLWRIRSLLTRAEKNMVFLWPLKRTCLPQSCPREGNGMAGSSLWWVLRIIWGCQVRVVLPGILYHMHMEYSTVAANPAGSCWQLCVWRE